MTFWHFLDRTLNRLPGWPSERQVVMVMTYALGVTMIVMAKEQPSLWRVELYKTLVTVVIVTGFVNMILAFYFAANKSDEARTDLDKTRAETTQVALQGAREAVAAVSASQGSSDAGKAAGAVADAAQTKAEEFKGSGE